MAAVFASLLPYRLAVSPAWLGLMLISLSGARLLFWSKVVFNQNTALISLFCVPMGIIVLAILGAKQRQPGPQWQHSHWVFLRRTMIGNAIGGVFATVAMAPVLLRIQVDLTHIIWGLISLGVTTGWVVVRCLQTIRASTRSHAVETPNRYGL